MRNTVGLGVISFLVSLVATVAYGQARTPYTRPSSITTTGPVSAANYNATTASGNQAYTCSNVGCRLSLGSTARYLVDDGTNLEFVAPLQATRFDATNSTGGVATFKAGNATSTAYFESNTTDAFTGASTGLDSAFVFKVTQDVGDGDIIFSVVNAAGNVSYFVQENGNASHYGSLRSNGGYLGGSASTSLTVTSDATDAITSGTVPALQLKASQNITDSDLLMSVEDSAGNRRLALTEAGSLDVATDLNDARDIYVTRYFFTNGETIVNGPLRRTSSSVTIADNGAGTPATHTQAYLSTVASFVRYTCNDANGCDITMSETAVEHGHVLMFANVSANNVTFADISGVQEMAGGVTATLGQYDTLQLVYTGDRWAELHRSDN